MATTISRRSLIKAAPAGALVAVVPAEAMAASSTDASIEAAWQRRLAVNGDTPEEMRLGGIMDATEEEIRATVAKTPRRVMHKLWVALDHSVMTGDEVRACNAGDLAYFTGERDTSQDWNARLMLSAIRSLAEWEA
jgi:2-C-methyl-D-erythritol 4-phosphate cytidylyltransferase